MEPELIRPQVYGYRNGYNAAKDLVIEITSELRKSGHTEWANEIHNLVWRRLVDQGEALVEAEEARCRKYDAAGKAAVAAFLATTAPAGSAHGAPDLRTDEELGFPDAAAQR